MLSLSDRLLSLLLRRGWRLVHPDQDAAAWAAFVADVERLLAEPGNRHLSEAERLARAAMAAYAPVIYAACCDHDSKRQERAFEELWHWVYPRIYRRVGHVEDAKDLSQQVLIKVYRHLDRVRRPRGFWAFVNIIAHREVSEHYRRLEQQQKAVQRLASGLEDRKEDHQGEANMKTARTIAEAELEAAEQEIVALLRQCLQSPRGGRLWAEVLIRRALLQQSVSEVAAALAISPNQVYLAFHRAKQELWKRCAEVVERLIQYLTPSQRSAYREGSP